MTESKRLFKTRQIHQVQMGSSESCCDSQEQVSLKQCVYLEHARAPWGLDTNTGSEVWGRTTDHASEEATSTPSSCQLMQRSGAVAAAATCLGKNSDDQRLSLIIN